MCFGLTKYFPQGSRVCEPGLETQLTRNHTDFPQNGSQWHRFDIRCGFRCRISLRIQPDGSNLLDLNFFTPCLNPKPNLLAQHMAFEPIIKFSERVSPQNGWALWLCPMGAPWAPLGPPMGAPWVSNGTHGPWGHGAMFPYFAPIPFVG